MLQDVFVQKDQGIEGQCLGRGRDVFIQSQVIQEGLYMGLIQAGRMLFFVEENILPGPVAIALLGAGTVVASTNSDTELYK